MDSRIKKPTNQNNQPKGTVIILVEFQPRGTDKIG